MKGITQEELVEWRDEMTETAKKNLLEYGQLIPVTLVMLKDPESGEVGMGVLEMDMSSSVAKDIDAMRIKHLCSNETVYGLVLLSEVWMAKVDMDKEELDNEDVVPPSERDDKKECLMCSFESTGESSMKMFDIVRDADDKIIDFVEIDNSDTEFKGRFTDLLSGL